ncbi:MAG: mechanosensitive ion channel family protein [Acidobacteriia bacterium]|nr:mechanosensitive ion channel family protein [Terriglobia bacterium]
MKVRHWITVTGLACLVGLVLTALLLTRDAIRSDANDAGTNEPPPLVDESPLNTARDVATLATGADEQRLAAEALRLADHEVDLEFSYAMRVAAAHPVHETADTKDLYARVSRAEAQVKTDQDLIAELKKESPGAHGSTLDDLQQQVDLVQAQLELDNDELDDAKGDLIRSGADPLSMIQRQYAQFEAAQQEKDAHPQTPVSAPGTTSPTGNLVAQFNAWYGLRGKVRQLRQARDQSRQAVEHIKLKHAEMEKQFSGQGAGQTASSTPQAPPVAADSSRAVIDSLHRLSEDQKSLADLDKQIQTQTQLVAVYRNWVHMTRAHQRAALRGIILSTLLIIVIVLAVYLGGRMIDRFFTGLTPDQRRLRTLRVVARFVLQALAVLLVLFVLFGVPNQTPTILGLAGAGLTVALKDFIVGFFGWFVLMGRNGIRVGDWVEINGVVGEVAEIGLLRTVLLETGNWTDAGHPTGRKVAFVNSFAIEGHFFNFSTTGQWLWDEIQILVPASENPYPVLDAIQKLVTKATEVNAREAEEEWRKATNRERMHTVSAAPAINLRPTTSGVEVHVRYITRAHERYAMRAKLYQELVGLLHQRREDTTPAGGSVAAG